MPINLCFHRFPAEAAIIGRLLAAFGELEVTVCYNAGKATNLGDLVVAALYRIRATRSRLEAADALGAWLHRDPSDHERRQLAAANARFDPAARPRVVSAARRSSVTDD